MVPKQSVVFTNSSTDDVANEISTNDRAQDAEKLAHLGYRQEFKREFTKWDIFGLAFSILGLIVSISNTLVYALNVGGVGMTWGWFVPMVLVCIVAYVISELASCWPTAGSLYYWTWKLAPPKYRRFMSYFDGWCDMLGLWFGCCSGFYGVTLQLLSSIELAHPKFKPSPYVQFGVFVAALVWGLVMCQMSSSVMAKLQSSMIYLNVAAVCIVVIALPVGLRSKGLSLNSGEMVFGSLEPATTNYPKGFAFILGWNCAIYCSSILDAPTHMAEETKDAERAIPFAVMLSCGLCFGFGFVILCVLAAVIDWTNADALFLAELPMAVIIQRCLGTKWSLGLMSIFTFIQFNQALSSMYANSRQCFALARDNALPLSPILRKVDKRGQPYAAVLCTFTVALALGLLILAGHTAAEALFSMSVTSIYMAWAIPIWLYTYDSEPVIPGPFYVHRLFSRAACYIASAFCFLVIFVITLFPSNVSVTSPALMNWSVVVCCGTWLLAILWYYIYAKKVYKGPVTTIQVMESEAMDPEISDADPRQAEKDNKR